MKGKIILVFVFALLALTVIGLVGQNTLTQLIVSIKKDSEPNQMLTALKEVMTSLSDAENSVRTYTITREPENLTTFFEATTTIDNKINSLYQYVDNEEQLLLIDSMKIVIEQKYDILKALIDVKRDNDTEQVLARVLENIDKLRDKDSIPQPVSINLSDLEKSNLDKIKKVEIKRPEQNIKKLSIFQRIFGGFRKNQHSEKAIREAVEADTLEVAESTDFPTRTRSYLPPSENDLKSSDIGQVITQINRERNRSRQALKAQELSLTQRDNELTLEIRKFADRIEEKEKISSVNRAKAAQEATAKTINIITITWVATLAIFAILLFIILNDIARNQRNKERLKRSKDRAEKLAMVKEEFLSNMSHEIRTPLNSIIGYTEQLESTPVDHEQKKYLNSIHHSGFHLLRIINDILDYAKLESGKLSLENIGFSVHQHINEVIDSFRNELERKNLVFKLNIDPDVPDVVIGDPVRFKQIFINLISNAIKFTHTGGIILSIQLQDTKYESVRLKIILKDSGIGIPKERLNDIFQNFAQVDSTTTRKYGGTGLGLSIVKKIVDMHDGQIKVNSEEGQGTEFIISLKYKKGTLHDLIENGEDITPDYDQLKDKKILVVDDQEFNLELIRVIFTKWNIDATLAHSGWEAIKLYEQQKFDLILMDIQMPEMSGLEATHIIRKKEGNQNKTPIIALTAIAAREEAEQYTEAGMDAYLLKPFTQRDLYIKLVEVLGSEVELKAEKAEKMSNSIFNFESLEELSDGDPTFVIKMLEIFKNNFEKDLYDLQQAVEENNHRQSKAKAHKMVTPCRHLNLHHMANLLKAIELEENNDLTIIAELTKKVNIEYESLKPILEEEIKKQQTIPSESTV